MEGQDTPLKRNIHRRQMIGEEHKEQAREEAIVTFVRGRDCEFLGGWSSSFWDSGKPHPRVLSGFQVASPQLAPHTPLCSCSPDRTKLPPTPILKDPSSEENEICVSTATRPPPLRLII